MKQHGPFKDSDERREFEVRISAFVRLLQGLSFPEKIQNCQNVGTP